VIEWASDAAEEPAVAIARTVEEIEHWYRKEVLRLWLEDTDPAPPAEDVPHDELIAWMDEWRESSTDAWLTVYRRQLPS
jgi:hypothetical protein